MPRKHLYKPVNPRMVTEKTLEQRWTARNTGRGRLPCPEVQALHGEGWNAKQIAMKTGLELSTVRIELKLIEAGYGSYPRLDGANSPGTEEGTNQGIALAG